MTLLSLGLALAIPLIANADYVLNVGDEFLTGSYPQTRLTSTDGLKEHVDYECANYYYMGADPSSYLDEDSLMIVKSEVRTYKREPIVFNVISVDGDKVTAISKEIIEAKPYNTLCKAVSWENSTLNSFLKNEFKASAFSDSEFERIDCVRIASVDEYNALGMGKAPVTDYLETKKGNFNYALNFSEDKSDIWWLSSDGVSAKSEFVKSDGTLCTDGAFVDATFVGVRPVIEFSLLNVEGVSQDGTLMFRPLRISGNDVYLKPTETLSGTALVAALYDGDVMVDVKCKFVDTEADSIVTLKDFYDFAGNDGVVKLLWFENLSDIKPLCTNITIDNTRNRVINITSLECKNGCVTVSGNIDLQALSVTENVAAQTPWTPVEVSLQMSNSDGGIVYLDQVTADDDGDYSFNFNVDKYKGESLKLKINSAYNRPRFNNVTIN